MKTWTKCTFIGLMAIIAITATACNQKKSEADLAQEAVIAELQARLNALEGLETAEAAELKAELETAQRQQRERSGERSGGGRRGAQDAAQGGELAGTYTKDGDTWTKQ